MTDFLCTHQAITRRLQSTAQKYLVFALKELDL